MPNTFHRINQLVAEWEALQPIAPEARKKLDKKFRLEFNYNSNHLEGNSLTYGETELLLYFDDTLGNHTMREYEEMKAHDAAWQLIEDWAKDMERPLTEQAVKNLNQVILVRPFWKEAITPDGQQTRREITIGNYKQYSNSVRLANGEMFDYASPMDTQVLMQELLQWYKEPEEGQHPVTLAAMLHYKFVRIHPFDDGNGRIARLLMNYVLLRNSLPPVIIKSADKQGYLRALHLADTGNFDPFINYIAEQLEWSLRLSIKAAKGESIEEGNDWEKEVAILKKGNDGSAFVSKSLDALVEVIKLDVLPLLSKVIHKLHQFDDLFAKTQILVGTRAADQLLIDFNQLEDMLLSEIDKYSNSIIFLYTFNGYTQAGIKTFSTHIQLQWNFEAYRYVFLLDNQPYAKADIKRYNQKPATTVLDEYANACGRIVLQKIKESLTLNF